MEWLWAWLVFGSEVAALWLTPRILFSGKSSGATFAWLLGAWFVPILGPTAFVLIGRNRMHRGLARRKRRKAQVTRPMLDQSTSRIARPPAIELPAPLVQLIRVAERLRATPPSAGNHVELITLGSVKYERMLRDIAAAERQIHAEFYIWRDDATGTRLAEALAARAREGLEVRLLLDAVGSYGLPDAFVAELVGAGAQVAFFHPVNPLRRRFNVNLRNHRKIVIVDGCLAYTGGINVGDEYADASWRDAAVRIEGPAAAALQRVFCEDWHFTTDELLAREIDFPTLPPRSGGALVQAIASGPDEDFGNIHKIYFTAVSLAIKRIFLNTPYFVPDRSMLLALEIAAMRGVDLRILLPRRSDSRVVDAAARSYVDRLLRAGARVFLYEPGFNHGKTMIVDDRLAAVGSANMDVRSLKLNFEAGVLVYDEALTQELAATFENDLSRSTELRLESLRGRGLMRRTLDELARLASPLL